MGTKNQPGGPAALDAAPEVTSAPELDSPIPPASSVSDSSLSDTSLARWAILLGTGLFAGLLAAGLAWAACGPTLGLFFGPFAFAAVIVPPLALAENKSLFRLLIALAFALGTSALWLSSNGASATSFGEWAQCTLLLAAFAASLAGVAALLDRAVGRVAASALVILLAVAWLSWPVWLSPALRSAGESASVSADTPASSNDHWIIHLLVAPHPLFAANTAVRHLNQAVWLECSLVYRMTVLGQDIDYQPPSSAWPGIITHSLIAAAALGLASLCRRG